MQSDEQKAFKGLAGNVRTKGRYRIPFVLEPEGGKKLPGVLETYVVGEPGDPTPLLLSQHAQAALGLVKDMATSTCTLGRRWTHLEVAQNQGFRTFVCLPEQGIDQHVIQGNTHSDQGAENP